MKDKKILFGICGSFCNHEHILKQLKHLAKKNEIQVIVSENVYCMDTRFFSHRDFIQELRQISKREVWHTLCQSENVAACDFDLMVIAPMSASVASKLVYGDYDHVIALAAKAMLRNKKNIVFGFASNDGLGISAKNLGMLLNMKHFYAIPFSQDDPKRKERSIVACWELLEQTCELAMQNQQIEPILRGERHE